METIGQRRSGRASHRVFHADDHGNSAGSQKPRQPGAPRILPAGFARGQKEQADRRPPHQGVRQLAGVDPPFAAGFVLHYNVARVLEFIIIPVQER